MVNQLHAPDRLSELLSQASQDTETREGLCPSEDCRTLRQATDSNQVRSWRATNSNQAKELRANQHQGDGTLGRRGHMSHSDVATPLFCLGSYSTLTPRKGEQVPGQGWPSLAAPPLWVGLLPRDCRRSSELISCCDTLGR